jgi:peptidoglycan biosynthesis protein MviN/MurJ (putative lipid II flippase)
MLSAGDVGLGLINFNLVINSSVGTLVSDEAPAAIDKAFRIYMLPQGIFSVAIATVLFPTLARFAAREQYGDLRRTMANGMRQILLLLIPAAAEALDALALLTSATPASLARALPAFATTGAHSPVRATTACRRLLTPSLP